MGGGCPPCVSVLVTYCRAAAGGGRGVLCKHATAASCGALVSSCLGRTALRLAHPAHPALRPCLASIAGYPRWKTYWISPASLAHGGALPSLPSPRNARLTEMPDTQPLSLKAARR